MIVRIFKKDGARFELRERLTVDEYDDIGKRFTDEDIAMSLAVRFKGHRLYIGGRFFAGSLRWGRAYDCGTYAGNPSITKVNWHPRRTAGGGGAPTASRPNRKSRPR